MRYAAIMSLLLILLGAAFQASFGKNFGTSFRRRTHHQLQQAYNIINPRAPPPVYPPPPPPHPRLYPLSLNLVGGARDDPLMQQQEEGDAAPESKDILNPVPRSVETEARSGRTMNTSNEFSSSHRSSNAPSSQKTAFVKRNMSPFRNRVNGVKGQIERLRDKAVTSFMMSSSSSSEKKLLGKNIAAGRKVSGGATTATEENVQKQLGFLRALGPALIAVFGAKQSGRMSFGSLYSLALVGSSVGFYLFLYFISIGYALGIALPLAVALVRYCSSSSIAAPTVLHSTLVLLWAARLITFLLWREYKSWPALHAKIVQVNRSDRSPALQQKVFCWLLYSLLYVCMLSPCWFRLESDVVTATVGVVTKRKGRAPTSLGIAFQVIGLIIESLADWQKCRFKEIHRMRWCNIGLWKYSTHPNYAGEWFFWFGTVLAGLPAIFGGSSAAVSIIQGVVVAIGFVFLTIILKGATQKLAQKQMARYSNDPAFVEFQTNTGVFGPRRRGQTEEKFEKAKLLDSTTAFDETVSQPEEVG